MHVGGNVRSESRTYLCNDCVLPIRVCIKLYAVARRNRGLALQVVTGVVRGRSTDSVANTRQKPIDTTMKTRW